MQSREGFVISGFVHYTRSPASQTFSTVRESFGSPDRASSSENFVAAASLRLALLFFLLHHSTHSVQCLDIVGRRSASGGIQQVHASFQLHNCQSLQSGIRNRLADSANACVHFMWADALGHYTRFLQHHTVLNINSIRHKNG